MSQQAIGREALSQAGWYEGRKLENLTSARSLTDAGYEVWPALQDFLTEYSGITVRHVRNNREDSLWFDARRATEWADRASVLSHASRLGTRLAPIGYAHHDHLLLLASDDGRFFGSYDDFLADLGTSPEAMVECVLTENVRPLSDA